jgi:energy-coupling factor transporter ATP-binding protein EcfA2
MAHDIAEALDLLDLAIGRAVEIVEPESVKAHAETAAEIRKRLGFLGTSVVVALVGGTGSGKSSLLNALAGEQIAPTGVLRPTTDRPLAWIPANPEPGLIRLLDDLGVQDRVGHDTFGDIAILDLPDNDSVVGSHRLTVERLLPRVDAVIWILDPEKYNDRLLHRDFLGSLRRYSSQFLFVLNQIDRLSPVEEAEVVADILRALADDGIADARLLAVAADPDEGPPIGIARLSRDLLGKYEAKQAVMAKALADLREARDGVAEATGIGLGQGTAYDDRWEATARQVADSLVESLAEKEASAEVAGKRMALSMGGGPVAATVSWLRSRRLSRALGVPPQSEPIRMLPGAGFTRAAALVTEFVTDLSFEVGGPFGRTLREEVVPEHLESEIGRSVEAAVLDVDEFSVTSTSRWWRVAGAFQWLVAAVLIAGVLWLWSDPGSVRPGGEVRPIIMVVAALLLGSIVRAEVVAVGRQAGRRSLDRYAQEMKDAVRSSLDRRIGAPIRIRMRARAEVAGALAELGIVTAEIEASLEP